MATLEVSLDLPPVGSSTNRSIGRFEWRAIDQDVEMRTNAEYDRPRRLRERLLAWLIEYNKY